jgi:hypothetical protein
MGSALLGYIMASLPPAVYLGAGLWPGLRIVRVPEAIAGTQEGIRSKLADIERCLQKAGGPPA